ncbi:MAG: DUF393 domain-containing protein [Flavobacteriales bacterium]|nr:DUF393 domain-containing protein [Flavobacteriales bacterium]
MPIDSDQRHSPRVLFFDGVCGLCNRLVDHLLRADRNGVLRFAPLQGSTAKELLPADQITHMQTLIYQRHGKMLQRSDAALQALIDLGGWRRAYRALFLIPRFVRDAVYDLIARNRYRLFGKRDACRIPTAAERERFLP